MTSHLIELNGSTLRCFADAELLAESPGYAIVEARELIVGDAARGRSRANPRRTYNRFWERLNQEPLPGDLRHARHHADLAFAHLAELLEQAGGPAQVVIATNGAYTQEQLALVLGLCQAAGVAVSGLVDAPVAAAAACLEAGRYQHLELEAHRLVLTSLEVDGTVSRGAVDSVEEIGLVRILEACAKAIGDAFIRHSRFDPFHFAETEQALYDALPGWLESAGEQGSEMPLVLEAGGRRHELRLPVAQLVAPLRELLAALPASLDPSAAIVLGDRLARLPGLEELLGQHAVLPASALPEGSFTNLEHIAVPGEGLRYVTRLPVTGAARIAVPRREGAAEAGAAVTHLVGARVGHALDGRAVYIGADGRVGRSPDTPYVCRVYSQEGDMHVAAEPGEAVVLNGRPLEGTARLRPGDRLRIGTAGEELRAIRVND